MAGMLPGASGLLREKADGHNKPSPNVTQGILKAWLSQLGEGEQNVLSTGLNIIPLKIEGNMHSLIWYLQ